jgi:hypothetical protein
MKIELICSVSKDQLLQALYKMTIDNVNFKGPEWCEWDAEQLEKIARMIRREIKQ